MALVGCPNTTAPIPSRPRPTTPPVFGTPVSAEVAPPPISGGTLIALSDGMRVFAADPDRDAVFTVNVVGGSSLTRVALERGDEPGRAVEDRRGRVHVALRGTSHVAVLDPGRGVIEARREVCRSPRGVAYDRDTDTLHVACASGALVSLRAETGEVLRRLELDTDLRDVVLLSRGRLAVTRFRSAEVLEISASGTIASRVSPPVMQREGALEDDLEGGSDGGSSGVRAPTSRRPNNAVPHVAWRAVPTPSGLMMLHQRALDKPVRIESGGYGSSGFCSTSIVETAVTTITTTTGGSMFVSTEDITIGDAVLAVDAAISSSGALAFAVAGNARVPGKPQIVMANSFGTLGDLRCGVGTNRRSGSTRGFAAPGQVTAVAFVGTTLVAQLRQPAALFFPEAGLTITLSYESREDTGHTIFHSNSGAGLACASCHAEGDDDGHTWNFASIGPRRTQTFRGGLTGTEPFHWDGDMRNIVHLTSAVFTERMSGPALDDQQVQTLQRWIDRMPARMPLRAMDDRAERGRALFFDGRVGCASCHSGPATTNNQTVAVGTGAAFQVPTLRAIAWRAPYMHNGCAKTLRERFTNIACGGGDQHGQTSHLSAAQIDDLIAYLETL
jgi:mono/diheme cytochrome c family protein